MEPEHDASVPPPLAAALRRRAGCLADQVAEAWRQAHAGGGAGAWRQAHAGHALVAQEEHVRSIAEAATLMVAERLDPASGPLRRSGGSGFDGLAPAVWDVPGLTGALLAWRNRCRVSIEAEARRLGLAPPMVDAGRRAVDTVADTVLLAASEHLESSRRRLDQQLLEQQIRLEHKAIHDPLTGLANRALVVDRLGHALDRAREGGASPGVVVLDLDHLKALNDDVGYATGDQLLIAVAARLRGLVRPGDTVGRIGGGEFVVVCDDLAEPLTEAHALGQRVLSSMAEPYSVGGRDLSVTASVGVATAGPVRDAQRVLSMARQAMSLAKARGRARVAAYEPALDSQEDRRAQLVTGIGLAVDRHQFHLVYQPIFGAGTRWILGREALLRWHHPVLGPVAPGEFIPVAEQAGLIAPVGRWVLRRACEDCAAWRATGERHVGVSVNVSGRQLEDPEFAAQVEEVLYDVGLEPGMLTLEITESQLAAIRPPTIAVLDRLRRLGVRIAMDDFGTGYSSLSWLAQLPIDVLKIDHSLVSTLHHVGREAPIVQTTIRLAHTLGLTALAEGVETNDQLTHLVDVGCDLAQGYLLGPPDVLSHHERVA